MRKFLIHILIYISVIFCTLIAVLYSSSYFVKSKRFKNSQTESNTLIINENEKFDLLILGISHARNFSRYGNHEKIEKILNKSIINLGQGSGICGINEQLYYLKYFYNEGNYVDKLCIVLTPPMLSSETLPVASNTFNQEKFDIDFFTRYLFYNSENKKERIINYIQSKMSKPWLFLKPDLTNGRYDSLVNIDVVKVKDGFKVAYGEAINFNQFNKSCMQVEEIIKLAQSKNTKIVLFIPPAIFGKWPEHNETISFLKKIQKKYNCNWKDFSESMPVSNMYYDHHHLNTNGVIYFTNQFLKPFLKE